MSEAVRTFKLSPAFLEEYEGKQPDWGPVGYITYKRTYSRDKGDGTTEEFWETCKRVVEGCYNIQKRHCYSMKLPWNNDKAQRSAQEMFRRMWEFKWLPPGRGLWIMGTPIIEKVGSCALMNCFQYDTEVITKEGIKKIGDLVGTYTELLTKNGKWVSAPVRSFGVQKLYKLTLSRQGQSKTIYTTGDHKWFAKDRRNAFRNKSYSEFKTVDLRPGIHRLQYVFGQNARKNGVTPSPFGIAHGFAFGDGTSTSIKSHNNHVQLCGEKDKVLSKYFDMCPKHVVDGIGVRYTCTPNFFKEKPSIRETKSYLLGWLSGYFAADGNVTKQGQVTISSSKKDNIEFVKDVCSILGIGFYSLREETRLSNLTNSKFTMYSLTLMPCTLTKDFFIIKHHQNNFDGCENNTVRYWTVKAVEETDQSEEVYCATVKDYESFVLADNILTSNCAFISSEDIKEDFADPFCWLMDMLMLGVGVGFDTKGAGLVKIQEPKEGDDEHVVEDSREGWVELIRRVLTAYAGRGSLPRLIDYSLVRPAGEPIRGFGGTASGPEPLDELVGNIQDILDPLVGSYITSDAIVDICNLIGRCVVAGNVRRSAEIAFGQPNDMTFLNLKNPEVAGEKLMHHRWSSNNSVFGTVGMDYSKVSELTAVNGEPGYEWLDNARSYGRMNGQKDFSDYRVAGTNPCFTGDTKVAVADGRGLVSFKELAESGDDVPVYSMNPDTGEVSIKWGRRPRKTRENSELVRVHIEGYGYIDCTPDHRWILKDGTWKYAKDLEPKDSLSTFVKRQERVKKGGNKYWRVYTQSDNTKGRIFEHRLVAENNGMFGRKHTEETKKLIGQSSLERWQDSEFRDKISASYTDEVRETLSNNMKEQKSEWDKNYYLEQEAKTDLDTVWFGERLFAKKVCEQCSYVFIVSWRERARTYCSTDCRQAMLADLDRRKNNQRQYFYDRQKEIRHDQLMVYKDLEKSLFRAPLKKEWERECKSRGVPYRLKSSSWVTENPHVFNGYKELKSAAVDYNHRVEKVEKLERTEDVYCITVDDNHTVSVTPADYESSKSLKSLNVFQCVEQQLESYETCNLVETFPSNHDTYKDYERTLKFAYLYAKTVTLLPTHHQKTNSIIMRNRRIGCSMSGISQAMTKHGRRCLFDWCDSGYSYLRDLDKVYSEWLCIPRSVRITSVKPSGSVSLLPGVTPGIHYPHSKYYIRRIRFQESHPLVSMLKEHGYNVEKDKYSPGTIVAEFPIEEEYFDRSKSEVTMWEQLELAAQMQQYWADNQVSVTVTFNESEAKDIKYALELYETRLKGVSFLPVTNHGYVQAPYEEISKKQYDNMVSSVVPITYTKEYIQHDITERFCDGDSCEIDLSKK